MNDPMEQIEQIRKKVEAAQKKRDVLSGKIEAAYEQLEKLGYKSLDAAQKAYDKLVNERDKLSTELETTLDKFKAKYPELVD